MGGSGDGPRCAPEYAFVAMTVVCAGAVRRVLQVGGVCTAVLVGTLLVILRVGGGPPVDSTFDMVAQPAPVVEPVAPATAQGSSLFADRQSVDARWVERVSAGTGIPAPALAAYADAELAMRAEEPGCHLGWNTLAGIGRVESHHGTIGGRTLRADGHSAPTIVGPPLDGEGPVAAIRSTPASTAWHGDTVWEHAVGPMQFLGSTWDRWGTDGDGDGVADPRDFHDAALAAGHYLCADGHDLTTDSGWSAAVFSYNHDAAYVRAVNAAARSYASPG